MPLTIPCPECEANIEVPDEKIGQKVTCRVCSGTLVANKALARRNEEEKTEARTSNPTKPPQDVPPKADENKPGNAEKEKDNKEEKRRGRYRRDDHDDEDSPRPVSRPRFGSPNQKMAAGAGGAVVALVAGIVVWQVTSTHLTDKAVNAPPLYASSQGSPNQIPVIHVGQRREDDDPARVFKPDPVKIEPLAPVEEPKKKEPAPIEPKKADPPVKRDPAVRNDPPRKDPVPEPKKESEFDVHVRKLKAPEVGRFDVMWFTNRPVESTRRSEVARALEQCFKHPDKWVGYDALDALKRWGDKESVVPLVDCYRSADDGTIRHRVVEVLGEFKDAKAARELVLIMRTQPDDRHRARESLKRNGKAGEKEVRILLDEPDTELQRDGCRILNIIGTLESVTALETLMGRLQPYLKDGRYRDISEEARRALIAIRARAMN
jgi:hypothetical protein